MIFQLKKKVPKIHQNIYIAPSAIVIGDVVVGNGVSIWFQAVIRGDDEKIVLGNNTNIQNGCVLHTDSGYELIVGNNVTVGHKCILHSCKVSDNCLIGMNAVLSTRCKIGENCIIGANTLITQGKEVPDNSLILGNQARRIRDVNVQVCRYAHYRF
ncbi:MAG: gamma carbonic anhydrase family protein [Coxiellaceae bacterium]|jgi:carbonic anhydrase/acetyltransferase-like protein (isoleucine patch superfamily)|nr:gamma carbonic anhydrase family protein [Coxiellaceae bacterium]